MSNKTQQDKQKELLIEQIRKTPIVQISCDKVGISRATFYRWKQSDTTFAQEVDKALCEGKELVNDLAESQLISAIKDRNLRSIIFWLQNNSSAYNTTKVELSGQIGAKIETLSPEQEKMIRKAIQLSSLVPKEQLDEPYGDEDTESQHDKPVNSQQDV